MYPALSKVLANLIDKLKSDGTLNLWYTSLKNDDGLPSFRVYLQIQKHDEESVQSEFQTFMEENQAELGWTGQFIEPDPGIPDSLSRLGDINKACELILKFTKQFPESNRKENPAFWHAIKAEFLAVRPSVPEEHRPEFFHFLANNLAMTNAMFLERLQQI
jgi:hypothetical protein